MEFPFSRQATSNLKPVALMKLTEVKDADEVLTGHDQKDIVIEPKLDGWKAQIIKDNDKIHIFSRRGEEVTGNFPALVEAISLPNGTLVEGELVYWYENKQDVTKVTSLAGSAAEKAIEKAKELPGKMKLHLYDILWHKGKNVTDEPFSKRRELLESVVKVSDLILLTKQSPFSEWQEVMNKAIASGGEGIVLKLKDAKYHWKPQGETEAKPANVMWKYKGGVGKHEADDYVVYDIKDSPTGQVLALFGQYYEGKLYAISEISNFSAENEIEIKQRLKKGSFVIEIGFQERVPGGLRHQKFLRFRDDKKPKDATMHEFHVKHIDEFEPAKLERKAMFALAATIPSTVDLVTTLEQTVGKPSQSAMPTGSTRIGTIGNVDGDKMFRIVSKLESNGRTDVIGDAGTSFGPTQVHGPYFLSRLSGMPSAETITGMSREEMRTLSTGWLNTLKKLRSVRTWKEIPVDQEAVKRLPQIRRLEKTFIRQPNMVIERHGDRFVGKVLDTEVLRNLNFNVDSAAFKRTASKIYSEYITDNVALSALAQIYLSDTAPLAFQKFKRQFNSTNIRSNKALNNLIGQASADDLKNRINAVVDMVKKSGYDTTAPGAFNIYQLIVISNASGIGRVQRFLINKVPFAPGNLHYIQSSRFRQVLNILKKTEPNLNDVINLLLSGPPPNNGLAGFQNKKDLRFTASLFNIAEPLSRKNEILSLAIDTSKEESKESVTEQARNIMNIVERWLNYEHIDANDLRQSGLTLIRIDRDVKPAKLIIWTTGDIEKLQKILPKRLWGMSVLLRSDKSTTTVKQPETGLSEAPASVDVEARMPVTLFSRFIFVLKKVRNELKRLRKQVPEDELRRTVFLRVAEELGYDLAQLKQTMGEHAWLRFSRQVLPFSKTAIAANLGTLAFPGQYAEDIKSGKCEKTIRLADMPVEPEEVVTAVTYSGSVICRIKILSKETMSLPRLEKSFGKHVARSLEHKFGPHRRFVVIRFSRFDTNEADDGGDLDETKRGEILIDKEGTKLTRGQIFDHYAKPVIRKQIMSRIKDKPVLVYLGVGTNEKILKRNHDDKLITISNDDQGDPENPHNYWYWVKRRLLSVHEVFGPKTSIGFVDLDLHGGYSLEKAKEYAKKLGPIIKEKYNVQTKVYQSGGTGLHVEFELGEKMSIDNLRKEMRELLDKFNEDFEGATTSTVKGKGMRTDVSTLHNKGSLRVPGALGETWGKVKKPLSQSVEDSYGNNNFGGKESDTGPFGDGGAITPMPYQSVAPNQVGTWTASERRKLFRTAGRAD
jgi:hypothetical protein